MTLRRETLKTPNYTGADRAAWTTNKSRDVRTTRGLLAKDSRYIVTPMILESVEKGWPQRKSFCILLGVVCRRLGGVW